MTLVSTLRRPFVGWSAPVLLAAAALLLAGCSSSAGMRGNACGRCSDGPGPCGVKAPPNDLPRDPNPKLKYCRVWVDDVYRDVPKLVPVCGCTKPVDTVVTETHFVTKATPGRCYDCTTPSCDCDETAVQVCPGGYRWQEIEGCWKYAYCPPKYKWCKKQVHEEGISYCMEEPTTYETVAVRDQKVVRDYQYTPPGYKTVWCKELYKPGHWEWVAHDDCGPSPSCDCCKPYVYRVGRDCACEKGK